MRLVTFEGGPERAERGFGRVLADGVVIPMGPDLVGYLSLAVVIGVRGWMALSVYRLSKALGSKVAVLWAIGGFLPNIIGLVVLAVLSGRATGRLKKAGLRVGLLGARLPSEPPPGFACQETVGQFA